MRLDNDLNLSTLFFKMIQNGGFPILGTGSQMRSMIYLDNLVQAIVKASLSQNSFQQTYWVADTQPYSMYSIIQTVKEILEENSFKTSSKQLRLPHFIGNIAQFCDYFIQAIGLYNQKIHVLSEMNKTIACSIEKATKEINYIPQISLKEGMDRSLKWCIKNNLFN